MIMSLQPRKKNGACNYLITHFGWLSNLSVSDEMPSVFLATAQARWTLWGFCFSVNDVWLISLSKYSFQYGSDEYLNISFMPSVCSEDYIINSLRRRITVCGPTDSEGSSIGQTILRSYSYRPGCMPFDPLSTFRVASSDLSWLQLGDLNCI